MKIAKDQIKQIVLEEFNKARENISIVPEASAAKAKKGRQRKNPFNWGAKDWAGRKHGIKTNTEDAYNDARELKMLLSEQVALWKKELDPNSKPPKQKLAAFLKAIAMLGRYEKDLVKNYRIMNKTIDAVQLEPNEIRRRNKKRRKKQQKKFKKNYQLE